MDYFTESLKKHYEWRGKIETKLRVPLDTADDLSLAYTPGVSEPCVAIAANPALSFRLTRRFNTVAVVTDGTAVLGLGDIGPEAALPVMEGKCALFKAFADVDAVPICLAARDADEIVRTVRNIAPGFGGINLEDISAPRCFEIERRLRESCDIPVFHDDQHGTAIVTGAALLNALRLIGKRIDGVRVVINGAGSAGIAIAKFLMVIGVTDIIMADRAGILRDGEPQANPAHAEIARVTNAGRMRGRLADALRGADVFIGVSAGNLVTREMVGSMAHDAVVFALANPVPEISRGDALAAGAAVVGTGISNNPNQINNVLVFPGIFKGALAARAHDIDDEMKRAACYALTGLVSDAELCADRVIPSPFNKSVAAAVADAVAAAAVKSGAAREDDGL
jgi:malate dehydrogenase (oxaloacetate-decarboxylating)